MIAELMKVSMLKAEAHRLRREREARYALVQAVEQAADNQARYEAIVRADYGRDAIDVEAREVVDAPRLEAP